MNILLCSVPYAPSIGGIETVSALLAEQFYRAGHDVTVVTRTAGEGVDSAPWRIARRPGVAALLEWHRWADVVLHSNISLRFAWPLLLVRRPWVVAHHTWLRHGSRTTLASQAKGVALRFARNLAVSQALADQLDVAAEVIPNPYAHRVFRRDPAIPRVGDLVFVGRLVEDKGLHVLIDALALLRAGGHRPGLTVVGDGPQRAALEAQARRLGVYRQVRFVGRLAPDAVADQLRRHRVCVVPSVWEEPFGLVAVEALACGCLPVVAASGGLPEAVGGLGCIVPKGDPAALADALLAACAGPHRADQSQSAVDGLLGRHRAGAVAARYLEILTDARRQHLAARPA